MIKFVLLTDFEFLFIFAIQKSSVYSLDFPGCFPMEAENKPVNLLRIMPAKGETASISALFESAPEFQPIKFL
jgi:hypothetical protein